MRQPTTSLSFAFACATLLCAQTQPLPKAPTDVKPGSITYDEIPYPYPVSYLPLTLYGQDVRITYMDVKPAGTPNERTVVLFHGMNFGGFYFNGPIEVLRNAGFRVVVPDQIGFGRSSKPIIPYNFNDMAAPMSGKLLASLGVNRRRDRRPLDGWDAGRAVRRNQYRYRRARRALRPHRAAPMFDTNAPGALPKMLTKQPWRKRRTSSTRGFHATDQPLLSSRHLEARV